MRFGTAERVRWEVLIRGRVMLDRGENGDQDDMGEVHEIHPRFLDVPLDIDSVYYFHWSLRNSLVIRRNSGMCLPEIGP